MAEEFLTKPFIGDTFTGTVKIDILSLGAGESRVSITEVITSDSEHSEDEHLWVFDADHVEAHAMYETVMALDTLEEPFIEANGFMYV